MYAPSSGVCCLVCRLRRSSLVCRLLTAALVWSVLLRTSRQPQGIWKSHFLACPARYSLVFSNRSLLIYVFNELINNLHYFVQAYFTNYWNIILTVTSKTIETSPAIQILNISMSE
jgi:hypothetical protein